VSIVVVRSRSLSPNVHIYSWDYRQLIVSEIHKHPIISMYSSSGARNDDEIAGKEHGFACTCLTRKGSRRPEVTHRDGSNVIGHQIARRPASESQNNKMRKRPIDSPLFGEGASAGK